MTTNGPPPKLSEKEQIIATCLNLVLNVLGIRRNQLRVEVVPHIVGNPDNVFIPIRSKERLKGSVVAKKV